MKPEKSFTYCCKLRSQLVHVHTPRLPRGDIDSAAANLGSFGGDLLSEWFMSRDPA